MLSRAALRFHPKYLKINVIVTKNEIRVSVAPTNHHLDPNHAALHENMNPISQTIAQKLKGNSSNHLERK
jgi:hypothetical protein